MPEWADVFVSNQDDRATLRDRALFFVPTAYEALDREGLNTTLITSYATANKSKFKDNHAGRSVVTKVMKCQPIVYSSAQNFITLANDILESKGSKTRLSSREIVACVFRLREFGAVLSALGLSADSFAAECFVRPSVVRTASKNGARLQFVDAKAIYDACIAMAGKKEKAPADTHKSNGLLKLGDLTDFITTAVGRDFAAAVMKEPNRDGDACYVYDRQNLAPAPFSNHPWAVEA